MPRLGNINQSYEAVNGTHVLLGTIVATTTKNNTDTAVPFNSTGEGLKGKTLLVQPDAACYILPGLLSTSTVTTANGLKLSADQTYVIMMGASYGWLACLSVSGTANLKVWELV